MRLRVGVKATLFLLGRPSSSERTAAISPPMRSPMQLPSELVLPNLTLGGDVDPRFEIVPNYGHKTISDISCFMNALDLLATLSVEKFTGRTPLMRGSVPGYGDVEIEIKPAQGAATMQTRFAVWGLYYATFLMAVSNKFTGSLFGIFWEGQSMAWVRFQPVEQLRISNHTWTQKFTSPSQALLDVKASPIKIVQKSSNNNNDSISNVTNTTDASNSEVELQMSFFPYGAPMTIPSVFITVLATLKDVARYDSLDNVDPFEIDVGAYSARIQFEKADVPSSLMGRPSFEYRWVIQAAKQIPAWMMEHRFWESFFTIVVQDYVVGQGQIYDQRFARYLGEGNVTIS